MTFSTKFLLDSGDPNEYGEICDLAKKNGAEIWGATTNPSLIAKKLVNKKITQQEAFELQKQIVLEILKIVPGAVSAEVYADQETKAKEMVKQAREIASWHKRVVVKLPTTLEGFKVRTVLRKEGIPVNNTLVFSQSQVFAICLHEQIIQRQYCPIKNLWPPFISPFVGRLDDISQNGMELVANSMKMKDEFGFDLWVLEASVRSVEHVKRGLELKTELLTAPVKVYQEWLRLSPRQKERLDSTSYAKKFAPIEYWYPSDELLSIETVNEFMKAINLGKLNIHHELTDKGIIRFAQDWQAIITS